MNTPAPRFPDPSGTLSMNVRVQWKWLLALGVLLLLVGIFAVVDSTAATLFSMLYIGWALVIAGIFFAIQAFRLRAHDHHLFLHLFNAVLALVIGVLMVSHPLAAAATFTLLLAAYFVVTGIFRIVAGLRGRTPARGWGLLNGIITLILGILVWSQWPVSGLWLIGLFVGIDLIVIGWTQIMTALTLRRLPLA